MTARLWHLFSSLPLPVQAWLVFVLAMLGLGVWTASRAAGRAAGWLGERRVPSRAVRVVRRRREWRVRVACRGPQWLVDRRAARLLAAMDTSGAGLEEADHDRH